MVLGGEPRQEALIGSGHVLLTTGACFSLIIQSHPFPPSQSDCFNQRLWLEQFDFSPNFFLESDTEGGFEIFFISADSYL